MTRALNTTLALPCLKALPVSLKTCVIQDGAKKHDDSHVTSPGMVHGAAPRWRREGRSWAASRMMVEL